MLDGNSEIVVRIRSVSLLFDLIKALEGSRAVTNRIIFLRKALFSFMRAQHVLSYNQI